MRFFLQSSIVVFLIVGCKKKESIIETKEDHQEMADLSKGAGIENGRMPGLPLGILNHEIWTEEKAGSFVQIGKDRRDVEDVLGPPSYSIVGKNSTRVRYKLDNCYDVYPGGESRMVSFSIIYRNGKVYQFSPSYGG